MVMNSYKTLLILLILPLNSQISIESPPIHKHTNNIIRQKINKKIQLSRVPASKSKIQTYNKTILTYKRKMKYPPNSYPINHKMMGDPISNTYKQDIKSTIINDMTILAWSEKNYYTPQDEFAKFYIQIKSPLKKVVPTLSIHAYTRTDNQKIKYKKISDHLYEGKLSLKNITYGNHHIVLNIRSQKDEFNTVNTINYSKRYLNDLHIIDDQISSTGDLNFNFEADVLIKGNYLVQSTLYHLNKPIGYTEKIMALDRGRHYNYLSFYGKIINNSKKSGPYTLKNIKVSYINEDLSLNILPHINILYQSAEYTNDQFHNLDFNDPIIREKIAMVKEKGQ